MGTNRANLPAHQNHGEDRGGGPSWGPAGRGRQPVMPGRLVGRLALGVALPVLAATGAGLLGSWWWAFDLTVHFRVQYAAVLGASALGLGAVRWWKAALVTAAGMALNLALVIPAYLGGPAPAQPESPTLTVLSFNVRSANRERTAVMDYLRQGAADVVFLHESSVDWERDLLNADLPYALWFPRLPGNIFGTAVLTPPGAVVEALDLGGTGFRSALVTMPYAGGTLEVLGTHPVSPTNAARTARRNAQLEAVAEWSADRPGPLVVVGDLNTTPWSAVFRDLETRGRLVNSQRGFGLQASWPVGWGPLKIPLDHLLHTNDLTTLSRQLGPALGSDHYPLRVTLAPAA